VAYPIVVGVDGSEESRHALDWAADEAVRRDVPLRIVHGWMWMPYGVAGVPMVSEDRHQLAVAEDMLDEAGARVRERAPQLEFTTKLDHRVAAPLLIDESKQAQLVVVGSRGHGGFVGLLLGSVSLVVAAQALCPVVVVRKLPDRAGEPGGRPEILLGVDGRKPSPGALEFAFDEATRRRVRLRALHAWTHPLPRGIGAALPLVWDPREVAHEEAQVLGQALTGWTEKYPTVEVVEQVSPDQAGKALVAASAEADLLVVGAHRRHGVIGLALGPVNHAVLHHARCPVAIVPERD
jgi:nucleotide-binding universal stress UspA family protein